MRQKYDAEGWLEGQRDQLCTSPREILLLVDVAENSVTDIAHSMHHTHPETATAAVDRGAQAFGF